MLLMFYAIPVLVFPAGAVWAWLRSGTRGLCLVTLVGLMAIVLLALIVASEPGGNRLAETYGYTRTAARTLRLATLTSLLPLIASAAMVRMTAPHVGPGLLYPIAVGTALVVAVVGSLIAMYTMV